MVPLSTMVHFSLATFSPTLPLKTELPFRLKSPSKPCPIASCKRTPGHPEPRITGIFPAGASLESSATRARRMASLV